MSDLSSPTPAEVLATPIEVELAEATTIGDYLVRLLSMVWKEKAHALVANAIQHLTVTA